jgi:hypothetical protein
LEDKLHTIYLKVELWSIGSIACFDCIKQEDKILLEVHLVVDMLRTGSDVRGSGATVKRVLLKSISKKRNHKRQERRKIFNERCNNRRA